MPVAPILQLGNPVLRQPSAAVAEPDGPETRLLAGDLRDTLLEHRGRTGYGRGIAAPQIGSQRRVVHLELDGSHTLVNPVITDRSAETMVIWDFCFSYFSIFFPVRRHVLVEVKYQDLEGRDRRLEAVGHLAELLQHEVDHLDGVLAIDLVNDVKRICTFEEWVSRHGGENERIVAEAVASLRGA
jgi:peptide deformylase